MLETVVKGVKQTFGEKYQVFLVPDPDSEEADPKGGPRCVAYAKLIAVSIVICLQSGYYKTALCFLHCRHRGQGPALQTYRPPSITA